MAQLSDGSKNLLTAGQALGRIGQGLEPCLQREQCGLYDGFGRVLADDIIGPINVPAADNAAVDGYGCIFAGLNSKGITSLDVIGTVRAGDHWDQLIKPTQALRVFTGAAMPGAIDTILMQEDCRIQGETVIIPSGIDRGANYRHRGEDMRQGDVLLRKGHRLQSQDIGLLASIGRVEIGVRRFIKAIIFSSGAEVMDPSQSTKAEYMIYDSNRYTITHLARQFGVHIDDGGIISDSRQDLERALKKNCDQYDMIIVSGGLSAGQTDHVGAVLDDLGTVDFWRLAIRPGRPLAMGRIGQSAFIGLPGNPVAAMVTFLIFGRRLVYFLQGRPWRNHRGYRMLAAFDYRKKIGRREWLRGILVGDRSAPKVDLFAKSGAGILTSMVAADGLIELAEDIDRVRPGDRVPFLPLREMLW